MNQLITSGIILRRTDFGEADRIITLLTPDYGKLRLMAKGVRRLKSKLAGGVELFSVSRITFIKGRGDISTLVSARLEQHYGNIVKDISRTMLGYDLIKILDRATEDDTESDYFAVLQQTFAGLDNGAITTELTRSWFFMQLLRMSGHTPNLLIDTSGQKLSADQRYEFDYENMHFFAKPEGNYGADEIKFLRLGFSEVSLPVLAKVQNVTDMQSRVQLIVQTVTDNYVRR